MIACHGNEMLLTHGGQQHSIRAFLQETRSRSRENAQREFSSLGECFLGRYVYIGPAAPEAAVGDTLEFSGRSFSLRRAETVYVGGKAAYCWGLCVEKGGDTAWGS